MKNVSHLALANIDCLLCAMYRVGRAHMQAPGVQISVFQTFRYTAPFISIK